ncbi:hypothetical protein ACP26E_21735 [Franconibacter pulveris 601]|uniref:hypothetical protein n=1 Tax=Franconibacter pulveris TaxID=435910 RepID=UPI000A419E92|nr:hypothetical protein [Franconibacter pulveris]
MADNIRQVRRCAACQRRLNVPARQARWFAWSRVVMAPSATADYVVPSAWLLPRNWSAATHHPLRVLQPGRA